MARGAHGTRGGVIAAGLAGTFASLLFQWTRAWRMAPDPGAGWLAVALGGYLAVKRLRDRPPTALWRPPPWSWLPVLASLALLPPLRLFLEPFPGWPLVEWVYAALLIGLSLWLIALWKGPSTARHFAFPFAFGLTALPWPAAVSADVITPLRAALARVAAELSTLSGEPALAQGTVIRLAHATIGIAEACGGIRSMQFAVVFGLAAGELRRDRPSRRVLWVAAGVALSIAANGARLCALTLIGGKQGAQTLAAWHDRADWLEFVALLAGLGLIWLVFRRGATGEKGGADARPPLAGRSERPAVLLSLALLAVLALSESAARLWYRVGAPTASAAVAWTARLPRSLPSYRDDPFTPTTQSLLGCDFHELGHWLAPGGGRRAGSVLEWQRGQGVRFTLLLHNPDVCVPAAGGRLLATRPPLVLRMAGADLPFERREFAQGDTIYYLYFLVWNLTTGKPYGATGEIPRPGESWLRTQWREVAGHRASLAVRSVAIAIYDAAGPAAADAAFSREAAGILAPSRLAER